MLELRRKLLAGFSILTATLEDHVEAARLRNRCIAKGVNVSTVDCLIAASAIAGGHSLFALDEDFEAMRRHSELHLIGVRDLA